MIYLKVCDCLIAFQNVNIIQFLLWYHRYPVSNWKNPNCLIIWNINGFFCHWSSKFCIFQGTKQRKINSNILINIVQFSQILRLFSISLHVCYTMHYLRLLPHKFWLFWLKGCWEEVLKHFPLQIPVWKFDPSIFRDLWISTYLTIWVLRKIFRKIFPLY